MTEPGSTQAVESAAAEQTATASLGLTTGSKLGIQSFHVFVALQALDFLTTAIVLRRGGYEANPLVNQLMRLDPLSGLLAAKLLVVTLGAATIWWNRARVVFIANYIYMAVVCWNLIALA